MNEVMTVKVLCGYKNIFDIISKYSSKASITDTGTPILQMEKYTQREENPR